MVILGAPSNNTRDSAVADGMPDSAQSLIKSIQTLYADLALHPEKDFGWGKGDTAETA